MIDDKKIEEAASVYGTNNGYSVIGPDGRMSLKPELENAFEAGANWAINELSKNLWHPASEKPNIKQGECCVTCLVKFKNESTELCVYFRNPEGWAYDDMSPKDFKRNFKGWLYIDDLFLKKDKHD